MAIILSLTAKQHSELIKFIEYYEQDLELNNKELSAIHAKLIKPKAAQSIDIISPTDVSCIQLGAVESGVSNPDATGYSNASAEPDPAKPDSDWPVGY